MPGKPRSSSLGRSTITDLVFQGTLFLSRGVVAFVARFATDLEGVGVVGILGWSLGPPTRPFDLGLKSRSIVGVRGLSIAGLEPQRARAGPVVDTYSLGPSGAPHSPGGAILTVPAPVLRSVSLLDCFARSPRGDCRRRLLFFLRLAFGVRASSEPSQAASSPENEPLNEEFSLSPVPSLNQCRFSWSLPRAVCWRIQPSVMPWAMRLARFARTVAAALMSGSRTSGCDSWTGGAGRRNGVWRSKRWIGDSSDSSLLKLWLLEL